MKNQTIRHPYYTKFSKDFTATEYLIVDEIIREFNKKIDKQIDQNIEQFLSGNGEGQENNLDGINVFVKPFKHNK
tara:strand:- start:240 stop:464 length:225 start_codon:yes stop_codon:yes gene_type:complete